MESIYLKTLVEVARTGSITKAAEALAVTQSAASRRIRFLEEQFGQPLLDRSGATLSLTAAGRLVVEKTQKILDVERELVSALNVMVEKAPGLSFVCTPTFGIVHLPEILRDYAREQTGVGDLRVALEPSERIVAGLRSGSYGMAVIEHCECVDLPDFDRTSLAGDEMVFAAAPALGIDGHEVDVDRLLSHTLYTRPEGCCSTLLQLNLERSGRSMSDFRRVVVYDDLHVIVRAVIQGEGVAFVSSDVLRLYEKAGRLEAHRVRGFQHQRDRTLVRAQVTTEGHAAAFVDRVVARVGRAASPPGCA